MISWRDAPGIDMEQARMVPFRRLLMVLAAAAVTACGKDGGKPESAGNARQQASRGTAVPEVTARANAMTGESAGSGRPSNQPPTVAGPLQVSTAADYPWLSAASTTTVQTIPPPAGFTRLPANEHSFGRWLRGLPIRSGPVHLYDGRLKSNQSAHHAVVIIDVGTKDLQQCADAVIRLRAEYLFAEGLGDQIAFHFTSGDLAEWAKWRDGWRPRVRGSKVAWATTAAKNATYACFRGYLDTVFTYAGSASLARELKAADDPQAIKPGDVFIKGGSPGHAVIVVDVAATAAGERVFLLAQSYMPAQEIHILRNPGSAASPWYPAAATGELRTPEWTFRYEDLRRFPGN